ncbi:hypothetical protein Pen01_78400 [Phytomonospora endophytica]|nr:hypothetical protein Pen01_78400 [Phytomonospora endophytica]
MAENLAVAQGPGKGEEMQVPASVARPGAIGPSDIRLAPSVPGPVPVPNETDTRCRERHDHCVA